MKLYGHFLSAPSNKTRLAATAVGQDFDYVHVELSKGEHKVPDHLRINPVGKVPALQEGDFCLFESDAITRYIANKNPSDFYPQEIKARAQVDQWIDFSSKHILANVGKVLFNKFFAPTMGVPVDEQSMADGEKFLKQYMPIVEKQLESHSMLTGDKLTLADVSMIAAMDPLEMIGFEVSAYPNIKQWRDGIRSQDFYQKVHKHYAADLPPQND
ncbi:MAG: glutathione S-transferase family protein [Gammaproteobacteria bacterium]|nr:glutathione S-transferase family protein [Gammaproteobacteria bacterium]NNC98517.1 glutathione S-transferase family protein [Gammaproteobacteria bacterium]NNM13498.1 glutathione S-transferase family protein [Gammaproteobacteria bacterium]